MIISNDVSQIKKDCSSNSETIAYATYGMLFKNYGTVGSYYKIMYNNAYAYIKISDVVKDAILVDISEQKLNLYQNGKMKMDSLIITGLKGVYDTPKGVFTLKFFNKAENTDYFQIKLMNDSLVDYWMSFYGVYSFHDADAKMLYEVITNDTKVYLVE